MVMDGVEWCPPDPPDPFLNDPSMIWFARSFFEEYTTTLRFKQPRAIDVQTASQPIPKGLQICSLSYQAKP